MSRTAAANCARCGAWSNPAIRTPASHDVSHGTSRDAVACIAPMELQPWPTFNLGTRTDCTRDNRVTLCPNSSHLGFSTNKAKRGSWITFEIDNLHGAGRVVGRVHCEGKTYIEIIATGIGMHWAGVRWIEPCDVRSCYPAPNDAIMHFFLGDWTDAESILATAARGMLPKYMR